MTFMQRFKKQAKARRAKWLKGQGIPFAIAYELMLGKPYKSRTLSNGAIV